MKKTLMACVIVVVLAATASAGDPPQFMKDTYPEQALKGAWEEYQAVWSPNGAIPVKQKRLIALGVAA
jgi:alkylhydroperoxidase/carboxymuconolactone decarboxylase family protein YurZ